MGQQTQELANSIIQELDLPLTVDQFVSETRIVFEKLFGDSKIMPGKSTTNTRSHTVNKQLKR